MKFKQIDYIDDIEEEKQADSRPARAGAAAFTCSRTVVLIARNAEQDGYYYATRLRRQK